MQQIMSVDFLHVILRVLYVYALCNYAVMACTDLQATFVSYSTKKKKKTFRLYKQQLRNVLKSPSNIKFHSHINGVLRCQNGLLSSTSSLHCIEETNAFYVVLRNLTLLQIIHNLHLVNLNDVRWILLHLKVYWVRVLWGSSYRITGCTCQVLD